MQDTYAQALWRMVEDGKDAKKAVAALREILSKHGRSALLPRIGRAFARIAARESAKSSVTLSVAREKDAASAKEILAEIGTDSKDVEVREDDTLIGGWRLEGREHLTDVSYKKYLLQVYNRVTQ